MTEQPLMLEKYYRLPWNLADNANAWIEPTAKCNIVCEGCYRENDPEGHRPLESVLEDLQGLKQLRRSDCVSIGGGEPLIYPHIVELVRAIAAEGWKPVIISNGHVLTPELVKELKEAGLVTIVIHIDSHQRRPGWIGKSEEELNELRLRLAEMVNKAGSGSISCFFNTTIYHDTVKDVPVLVRWAQEHMRIVHSLSLNCYRYLSVDMLRKFDFFVKGKMLSRDKGLDGVDVTYSVQDESEAPVTAVDIIKKVREVSPTYEPYAYLSGTEDTRKPSIVLSLRAGNSKKIFGYMNPKFAELVQSFHHMFFGTYYAYCRPWTMKRVQGLFPLGLFNNGIRKVFLNWLKSPSNWFRPVVFQSLMIIQSIDIHEDGRKSMCDGCPDAMYYKGRLVWSCRLDELEKYDGIVECVPREEPTAQEEATGLQHNQKLDANLAGSQRQA